MEAAVAKISGVEKVTINFMTQKMTLEASEADLPRILEEAQQAIRKIERDCRIIL